MRKVNATKHALQAPLKWVQRADQRAVFHGIAFIEDVLTSDGVMKLVQIRHKVEIADPSNDIAALVGTVVEFRESSIWSSIKSPKVKPQTPELWYWDNKFWMHGVDKLGTPYYRNKCYVLYQVQIENENELLASMNAY